MMKVILVVGVLLLAAFVEAHGVSIHITEKGFEPAKLEIDQGETVEFENLGTEYHWPASNIHPTHEIYPEFDPRRPLAPNESWEFAFDEPGEWRFHDHAFPEFIGVITVRKTEKIGFFSKIVAFFKKIGQATGLVVEDELSDNSNIETVQEHASVEFHIPKDYDQELLYTELKNNCMNKEPSCFNDALNSMVMTYGPKSALELLHKLQNDGLISLSVDDHQIAHRIGREVAKSFGINGQAFLLCTTDFNYGCQHGFFEYALGKARSTKEVAKLICESLDQSYPSKMKFYCYHGVGHGVLMANAYDLDAAIQLCDTLASTVGQDGCWQGVFMENVNAAMREEARAGIFSKDDPLAPCNVVEAKYQHECFINHAGWLMKFFINDIEKATRACLDAPANYISSCLQSVGLMVTNPTWQTSLAVNENTTDQTELAWKLCSRFPEGQRSECVIGGLDNIMNFDELNLTRAGKFCNLVDKDYKNLCYQRIGIALRGLTTDSDEIIKKCDTLDTTFREECLRGAQLA